MTTITERLGAALADRYTIERELGRGGMATVYLARDVRNQRGRDSIHLWPQHSHHPNYLDSTYDLR